MSSYLTEKIGNIAINMYTVVYLIQLHKGCDFMENNQDLKIMVDDIEMLLDGILLSGVSVTLDSTLREVNRLAVSYDKFGLKEGASMLFRLEEALKMKRHTLNFEVDEVVKTLAVLGSYVSLIKDKMKKL